MSKTATERRRREAGLCTGCESAPEPGLKTCRPCRDRANERARAKKYHNQRTAQRAARGLCPCGKPRTEGKKTCTSCRARSLAHRKAVQARGLCGCGRFTPIDGLLICEACRERSASRNAEAKARRRCSGCGSDRPVSLGLCAKCRAASQERVRVASIEQERAKRRALRQMVIDRYGGRCACSGCDVTEPAFLSIDHIGGGGLMHLKRIGADKGGGALYAWLKKKGFPPGFRVLCYNCNHAHSTLGRCPHESGPDVDATGQTYLFSGAAPRN